MTVENWGSTITTDVTDLNSFVDTNLIENLRQVAEELENHNIDLIERTK